MTYRWQIWIRRHSLNKDERLGLSVEELCVGVQTVPIHVVLQTEVNPFAKRRKLGCIWCPPS